MHPHCRTSARVTYLSSFQFPTLSVCIFSFKFGVFNKQIHAPTPEIPRTKQVGTGARRRHPRGCEDARKAPRDRERTRRVASPNVAASPPKRMVAEGPTGMVRRPAAKTSVQKNTGAAALAAVFPRPERGNELPMEPPKSKALGLEVPCAAQERPSCGSNPSASPVPPRRDLHEAVSGG